MERPIRMQLETALIFSGMALLLPKSAGHITFGDFEQNIFRVIRENLVNIIVQELILYLTSMRFVSILVRFIT